MLIVRRLFVLVLAATLVPSILWLDAAYAQKIDGSNKKAAQKKLEDLLLNQRLIARVTFPAWKGGIDIKLNGEWDQKHNSRTIKDHGIGIDVDEAAVVTQVKLKGKDIEIHLNGGGFGTFGDLMKSSQAELRAGGGGKRAGGSRINLRFGRDIRMEDLDAEKLADCLAPLVDIASLDRRAAFDDIPEEFRQAAEEGNVVVGMSKKTVFAILGAPKERSVVDAAADPPVEKWIYEPDPISTLIVTFEGGVVVKIDRL